jgi:thiol-disulfide isomerase/thioredoxin
MKRIFFLGSFLFSILLVECTPHKHTTDTTVVVKDTTPALPPVNTHLLDLKIHINGVSGGDFMLASHYGDKQSIYDTVTADANGNIEFKADSSMPGGIYLVALPSKKYFEIVLTDVQTFSLETDTNDLVKYMKIKGSNENIYFYQYLNYLGDLGKQMESVQDAYKKTKNKDSLAMLEKKSAALDSLMKNYKRAYYKTIHPETFMAEVLRAMDEPDAVPYSKCPKKADGTIDSTYNYWNYRRHYWDGMDFTDDRLIRTPMYANKMKFYLDKLTPQTPDSIDVACDWLIEKARPSKELFKYTVYYTTYTYETSKIMGFDAVFVHLVNKYYKTNQVWWVSPEQLKKICDRADQLTYSLIGATAFDLAFLDTSGVPKQLSSIKAQYTVIIYWDPTCSHCKKEIPILKAYYDSLHKAGISFAVYAIYSELDNKTWKQYVKEHHLNWINVAAKTAQDLANSKYYYDVISTPTIYLLDKDKKIIGKRLDVDGLKVFLDHTIQQEKKKALEVIKPK